MNRTTLSLVQLLEIHVHVGNPFPDALSRVTVTAVAALPDNHLGRGVDLGGRNK